MRNSRGSRSSLLGLAIAAAAVTSVSAHRRDEFLEAARLAIDPDRVELQLDLTPGISLADRIIGEIDRDRDGVVSEVETRAYAAVVQRDIGLELDGHALPLTLLESRPASAVAMANGEGTLQLRWDAVLPPLDAGAHRLTFRNGHHNDIGVYLANVLVPASDRVAVTAQDRDADQREFTVRYELKAPPSSALRALLSGLSAVLVALTVVKLRIRPAAPLSGS